MLRYSARRVSDPMIRKSGRDKNQQISNKHHNQQELPYHLTSQLRPRWPSQFAESLYRSVDFDRRRFVALC